MKLQGSKQLKARLAALKDGFKPAGRAWAKADVQLNRAHVPNKTGRLRRSFRVRTASRNRASVAGHYTAYFVDKGPKAHDIFPKKAKGLVFQGRNGTVFAKKVHHRGYRGRPFRKRMAEEALRREPLAKHYINEWNKAA